MKKLLLLILLTGCAFSLNAQDTFTCNEALLITAGQYTVNSVNGSEIPSPICANNGSGASHGVWYKYTPTQDYSLTVSTDLTVNSGGDTRFHVYTGTCGSLVCHDGDDDSGDGFLSISTFNVSQGVTYYIAFDDRWSANGFVFELTENNPITPPPPAPVTFTVQSVSTVGTNRAVVDMNGDFLDDIVSIGSTNINILFQQSSGGFNATNITTTTADFTPSWSLAAADYDRNGFTDLLYGGGQGVTLMRANNNGTAFTEISGSQYVFSQRSNFIDINNDGHLDAFVCHDVAPNVYFLNDGNGNLNFVQGGLGDYPSGGNYGSIWVDYDNDRDLDMFIAKCGGEVARRTDQMHTNNGDGTYTENALAINLADPMQTWSSAWGDFDNDGDMDVFVGASSGTHKLMRNNNDGTFTNVTSASGVLTLTDTGHENTTYDFDNDGILDLASNGNILIGNGDLTFTVYEDIINGTNGAFGDLNNDGFIDAFNDSTIYMNDTNTNNWVKINLLGSTSNINGIGARVEIHTNLGIQIRDVRSGEGFRYMSTLNTHFGLGPETTINNIIVYWPSGTVDNFPNPAINSAHTIAEGQYLSVEDFELSSIVIHPNPVKDLININTPVDLKNRIATVFDLNGKRVLNKKLDSNSLDVSNLSSGIYILRLESNGKSINRKFVKQ